MSTFQKCEKHTLDDRHHFEVVWAVWHLNPWRSGRQTCSRLSEAGEVSVLLQVCVSRLLGQDTSCLDSPVNNGILPWIGKEPSGCANQYWALIAQNQFNIIAWKLITFCLLAQLQLPAFLQGLDTITCPWSAPLPPCLFLDLCFNDPEVSVSFIISRLKPFLKGGEVSLF